MTSPQADPINAPATRDAFQNERSRSSASSALLSLCFERDKRPAITAATSSFSWRFLEYAPEPPRLPRLRPATRDRPESPAQSNKFPECWPAVKGWETLDMAGPAQTRRRATASEGWSPSPCASTRTSRQSNGARCAIAPGTRQIGASSLARGYMRAWVASSAEGPVLSHQSTRTKSSATALDSDALMLFLLRRVILEMRGCDRPVVCRDIQKWTG